MTSGGLFMHKYWLLVWVLLSASCEADALQKIPIKLGVYSEHLSVLIANYREETCPTIFTVDVDKNEVLAEFLLLCEALNRGGIAPQFEFKAFPAYPRLLRELHAGKVDMLSFGVWESDVDVEFAIASTAIVPEYGFSKGLYTLPERASLLANNGPANLAGVTNINWVNDAESISCMGGKLVNAHSYINMFRMVAAGRADYLLITFPPGPDLRLNLFDVDLVPIPNMKVVFKDSLHFAISKASAKALVLRDALELGLAKMRVEGELEYYWSRMGFNNPLVTQWKNLGCH